MYLKSNEIEPFMKFNRFSFSWMNANSFNDQEIRFIIDFLKQNDCLNHNFDGFNKIFDDLCLLKAPDEYFEFLWNAYRKFKWQNRKNK